ncbi:ferredoxin [Mycolicibacterium sp. BK556]|uniref:ferredoxin n=1 Tax=Mycobacteriaceae TaxID=1762 RepID=UPI00105BC6FB|nr:MULTISPECIES: ferredoxin [Mycobacteriaceae]MBB3600565.1 ferredoxin [Mycolicibacterium sp. BK556]MBB3630318.1 ferredoxin [Mycolicibacterium sp. BK607]TDO10108.1 ferredoxin [Mycobacterium sp. BK086]
MKVRLIRSKCAGHAQCYAVAPEIFPIDDEGFCILDERVVEADEVEAARAGVASCPELALVIDEGSD